VGFNRWARGIAVLALASLGPKAARPDQGPEAAWQHLRDLAGTWRGHSSKGWDETIELRLIAGGSVLLETSLFADDAKGENAMATAYYKDGGRLLLTHYCEARNQPRLVASTFEDDGATVVFTFLDGTNLPSRNEGHMDTVVMRFLDPEHFSARWTWYADGREKWLEDIRYERVHH
jgi:hypothetical protein